MSSAGRLSTQMRRAFSFLTMLAFLLVTLEFMMTRGSVVDPDIWWHLRNAEYLFQHHQFPRADMYSFTVAGHPWINHEWLSEIPYYLAWRAGGLSGINAVMFAIISLIFLGLLYLSYMETRHFKAAIVACCFLTFIGSVSFGPRTILFGYLYLVLLLIILQRFRQKGTAPLWLIPPLFCLWANTHGSWSLGLIIFSIITAAGFAQGSWGHVDAERWTPSQMGKLVVTGLASVAALFVNPFGSRLVFYPFDMAFRQKLNISHVAEWVSVDFHDLRGKFVLALLLTLLVTALVRRTRWQLAEVGVVLFALYSGLTYIRFLFLLAVVIAPVLSRILDFVPQYRPEADTPVINAFVICLMVGSIIYYWPPRAEMEKAVAAQYPAEAVAYLKAHSLQGPMLNHYLWGGYLGWNDRDLKVFVDSRVDIFEYAGVMRDYLDLLSLKQSRLNVNMPPEFVDASSGHVAENASEEKIARAYWECAVDTIQWKYGYSDSLPQDPPSEFRANLKNEGVFWVGLSKAFIWVGKLLHKGGEMRTDTNIIGHAAAPSTRARYWDKLRQAWASPSARTKDDVKSILDKYHIRYVLLPHAASYSESALTYVLEHDPAWKEIYSDKVSVLLERADTGGAGH